HPAKATGGASWRGTEGDEAISTANQNPGSLDKGAVATLVSHSLKLFPAIKICGYASRFLCQNGQNQYAAIPPAYNFDNELSELP
ncbi:MAG: hypothetical protein ACK51D_14205, partial [Cyclobacteriaceae bacterium]